MARKYSVYVRDKSQYSEKHLVLADIMLLQKTSEFDQNDIDRLFMALDIDPLPFDVSFVTDEHLLTSDETYDVVFSFSVNSQQLFLSFICHTLDAKQRVLDELAKMKALEE